MRKIKKFDVGGSTLNFGNMGYDFLGSLGSVLPMITGKTPGSTFSLEQNLGNIGMMIDPIFGTYMKLSSGINNAFGTNMSTLTKHQANRFGISDTGRIANNIAAPLWNTILPGVGGFIAKTPDVRMSSDAQLVRGGYSDIADYIDTASQMSGLRSFSGKVYDSAINAQDLNKEITDIARKNMDVISSVPSNTMSFESQYLNQIRGGNRQTQYNHQGKNGLKLLPKEELAKIFSARGTKMFADGGKIGVDTNVIPDGALHKNKNNLEDINPELDNVTDKGIPVIITNSDNDYEQVAEIEKEELVLTKSLTVTIEELWKENTPESMLEAGKILAKELMENTVDNGDDKN